MAEPAGGAAVVREEAGHVAELAAVHEGDRVFDRIHPDDAEHRPEDLGAGDLSLGRQPVQHRRTHEEAVLEARDPSAPAVHDGAGVFRVHGLTDQPFDPLAACAPDDRSHVHRVVEPGAHHPALGGGADEVPEGLMSAAHRDRQRGGQTPLSGAPEGALGHRPDRGLDIGVLKYHHRVLGPALTLHPLSIVSGLRVHGPGHRRRAHEAHRGDVRMVEKRRDRLPAAVGHLNHAGGKPRFFEKRRYPVHRERRLLGRLHDHRVAAGERAGQEPERDHRREVERRDHRDHPDRLADHELVDAAGDVLEHPALHQRGNSAGHLHVFDGPPQLAAGLGQRLAALGGHNSRDFLEIALEEGLQPEKRLHPVTGRRLPPFAKRFPGARHRPAHVLGSGQRDPG